MNDQPAACRIHVEALDAAFEPQAEQWAERLGLPLQMADGEFALQVGEQVCSCNNWDRMRRGRCALTLSRRRAHRRLYGGGSGQMIAKAVGVAQACVPVYWMPRQGWARMRSYWPAWGAR